MSVGEQFSCFSFFVTVFSIIEINLVKLMVPSVPEMMFVIIFHVSSHVGHNVYLPECSINGINLVKLTVPSVPELMMVLWTMFSFFLLTLDITFIYPSAPAIENRPTTLHCTT